MLRSVLVANRGEIALRVFRTAKRMGIRTIAIHTDLDADAPHVRAADRAVRIESYLDIDEVIAAATSSGAEAIHPGYGFLSERAEFARALEVAGIRLVGPSADVMERMGRKDAAREIALAAGVPVVPSYSLETPVDDLAFPVLVKAAAGGGGKGMRVVRAADEYHAALASAAREAKSAFGDDTLLVEKYVESGRHIEVQVLGDDHGNVIHIGERDCSTQRRHQKVLEEAPGPTVDEVLRDRLGTASVELARAVGYSGAGTVEFLLDNSTGEFYFLEMNTRLQVEHPVTELAWGGLDLVKLQLQIAAGEELHLGGRGLVRDGNAIEARVYAEDSFGGFLPQAGTATTVHWPFSSRVPGAQVRVDHALESGQVVSTSYDPMLGKVIVQGRDREAARLGLIAALDDTAILGLTTNVGFLRALLASDEFRDATIDTAWLDHNEVPPPDATIPRLVAAHALAGALQESTPSTPFGRDGWRASGAVAPVRVELDIELSVRRTGGTSRIGDHVVRTVACDVAGANTERHMVDVDGEQHVVFVALNRHDVEAVHRGQRHVFTRPDPFAGAGHALAEGDVLAPMPGTVLVVNVAVGDRVTAGQALGALEAMKMELTLAAPFDGVVAAVGARAGQQVALGAQLFLVEEA